MVKCGFKGLNADMPSVHSHTQ